LEARADAPNACRIKAIHVRKNRRTSVGESRVLATLWLLDLDLFAQDFANIDPAAHHPPGIRNKRALPRSCSWCGVGIGKRLWMNFF
jgi:hypothetical protein